MLGQNPTCITYRNISPFEIRLKNNVKYKNLRWAKLFEETAIFATKTLLGLFWITIVLIMVAGAIWAKTGMPKR